MGKLNDHEKNLLKVISAVSNELMCGYSYRPNWNECVKNGELFRDSNLKELIQKDYFRELFFSIDLKQCNIEFLESIGFKQLDDEHTEKGQRLIPLWYYEILHNGETKEKKLSTDIRMGCVYDFVDVKKD